MKSREIRILVAPVFATVLLLSGTGTSAAAGSDQSPTTASATATAAIEARSDSNGTEMPQQISGDSQRSKADFYAWKTKLEARGSGFTYTSRPVAGGTEFTYRHRNGVVLVLAVPSSTSPPSSDLRGAGCGFLQACVFFNRADQRALIGGTAGGLSAAICLLFPAGCVYAAVIIGIGQSYLQDRGICSNELRIRILPFPDATTARCV